MTGATDPAAVGQTVHEGSTEKWKDKKRYLWLLGLLIPGFAVLAFVAYAELGWAWVLWIGPILVFGVSMRSNSSGMSAPR